MAGLLPWKIVLTLFLSQLAFDVNAGHPAWETSRSEHPEWVSFENYPQGPRYWPDKTIRYAFADDDARSSLGELTRSAHSLWLAAGLPDEFKIQELSLADCDKTREVCLLIHKSLHLSTPTGTLRQPVKGNRDHLNAYWTPRDDVGYSNSMTNIAHELGHAWGLQHEMQNRFYWANRKPRDMIFDWFCDRIQDFNEVVERNHLSHEEIYDSYDGICFDGDMAERYHFSGHSWLPWSGHRLYYSGHRTIPSIHDVDWDSLMMYPSYMGYKDGKDDHDFSKAIILKSDSILPEDKWIKKNMVPSQLDVSGIKTLYGHKWPIPAPVLLGDWDSPHRAVFKRIAPGCYTS